MLREGSFVHSPAGPDAHLALTFIFTSQRVMKPMHSLPRLHSFRLTPLRGNDVEPLDPTPMALHTQGSGPKTQYLLATPDPMANLCEVMLEQGCETAKDNTCQDVFLTSCDMFSCDVIYRCSFFDCDLSLSDTTICSGLTVVGIEIKCPLTLYEPAGPT
jgi:hypothetical protein